MSSALDSTNPADFTSASGARMGPTPLHWAGEPLHIVRASNDLLFAADERPYVDLLCGFGSVFLGHCDPAIRAAVEEQLRSVWTTARLETSAASDAKKLVEAFFPQTHHLAGLYSTGMEAAEFALRVARVATGRPGVIGFERSTHGKSMAMAYLGWHNDQVFLPEFHRLPFLPAETEEKILHALAAKLSTRSIGAVFVEPVHGSGEGHRASPSFYRELQSLCGEYGSLCLFDEILTGFHRTGAAFCFEALGLMPDLVLIGKAMGNGFPVSGVVANKGLPIDGRTLPGSTFSGNPLAASAVAATLTQMQSLDVPKRVVRIEQVVTEELGSLAQLGITLRGQGALWILQFPPPMSVPRVVAGIRERGVVVAPAGSCIRLLPPATISADHLSASCAAIRAACSEERRMVDRHSAETQR